jgi:hypothetical protein
MDRGGQGRAGRDRGTRGRILGRPRAACPFRERALRAAVAQLPARLRPAVAVCDTRAARARHFAAPQFPRQACDFAADPRILRCMQRRRPDFRRAQWAANGRASCARTSRRWFAPATSWARGSCTNSTITRPTWNTWRSSARPTSRPSTCRRPPTRCRRLRRGSDGHVIPGGINPCHRPLAAAGCGRAACCAPSQGRVDI